MKQIDQDDSGLKHLLTIPWFFDFFQERLLGGANAREWLSTNIWKPRSGEAVVDIGCGPGTTLAHLPRDIQYLGIDVSENYIRSARKKFSGRGTFFLGNVRDLMNQDGLHSASTDLVLCNGLLHHLTDAEALEVLELAKRIMKPGGRLVCLEPAFLTRQTGLSRWILKADRGRHVRLEQEWKNLVGQAFESYSTRILTGLLRIPYTHIVIECFNERSSGDWNP